jgi:hypothetical protein
MNFERGIERVSCSWRSFGEARRDDFPVLEVVYHGADDLAQRHAFLGFRFVVFDHRESVCSLTVKT